MPRRLLSDEFFNDLVVGFLQPLRDRVQDDKSLCLEFGDDCINIYYRGGNLIRLRRAPVGYTAWFDLNYFDGGEDPALPSGSVCSPEDVTAWLKVIPRLKQAIDACPKESTEWEMSNS